MSIDYGTNIVANLNVVDFKITNTVAPVLSSDFQELTLNYTGIANPTRSDSVDLSAYEYSTDNGVTWDRVTTISDTTGLTFSDRGTAHTLIWKIREDLTQIYNISIKIRLQAQAFFDPTLLSTDYFIIPVFLPKTIITNTPVTPSVFPAEYSGSVGSSLLKNAPKPEK